MTEFQRSKAILFMFVSLMPSKLPGKKQAWNIC